MDNLKACLINYSTWILAKQLGANIRAGPDEAATDFRSDPNIQLARETVGDLSTNPEYSPQRERLKSIFSFVSPHGPEARRTSSFPRRSLTIDLSAEADEDADSIWDRFHSEFKRLPGGGGDFETFYNLYRKYAWYIPSSLEMDGISLFEQFKAIAALSHCYKRGGEELLLVGGDLPGIQSMLYTITSKGAAKSLRGRSFYLQLLCDVLVQVTLRELSLPTANVIYSAGGNFKVLASAQDAEILQNLRNEINNRLLDAHRGELFAAMDWVELGMDEVMNDCAFLGKMTSLARKIGRQKRAWFAEHAKSGRYDDIFGVHGQGGPTFGPASEEPKNYCEVCQIDVDEDTRVVDTEDGTTTTKCRQCRSFEELPRMLYRDYFVIQNQAPTCRLSAAQPVSQKYLDGHIGKPKWEEIIESMGYRCSFEKNIPTQGDQVSVYKINDCDFLPENPKAGWTYGFKFIGNATPRMSAADVKHMREKHGEKPREGIDVRNTAVMAELHSTGIHRYGILRMDVDWLGDVFPNRLSQKDMLHTSALSAALSLFFEGWLNRICEDVAHDWSQRVAEVTGDGGKTRESKLPYIIYSGGDDLFIVGSWDTMPLLAERIRNDFASYVTRGHVSQALQTSAPCMTICAGISIFPSKFPIYQAASLAKDALDGRAKDRKIKGEPAKDAIDFLGVTIGWEDFDAVKHMAFKLAEMINTKTYGQSAPHALLTMLKTVADSYQKAAKDVSPGGVVYGKWMWQLAYSLYRLKERVRSDKLKEQIMKIGGDTLDLGKVKDAAQWRMIKYLNLPVRWAEFLIRKGE